MRPAGITSLSISARTPSANTNGLKRSTSKMARVSKLTNTEGELGGYMIFCPACKCGHLFDSRWEFNGNTDLPTFRPSMLVHSHHFGKRMRPTCHSFVTDGQIAFLPDSGHSLAGQTVDLPDWQKMAEQPCVPCEECAKEPCCEDHQDNSNITGCLDGIRL